VQGAGATVGLFSVAPGIGFALFGAGVASYAIYKLTGPQRHFNLFEIHAFPLLRLRRDALRSHALEGLGLGIQSAALTVTTKRRCVSRSLYLSSACFFGHG